MKKYFALLLFALFTTFSFGQSNYQDVVYLKNGSIIRGIIIEQIPNKSVKIETVGRNVFAYQFDEIEKLTKEPYQDKEKVPFSGKGLQAGYRGIVEFGYQGGLGDIPMDRIKMDLINGYQFNPYFSMGFGTGVRWYTFEEEMLIPVYADFRANLTNKKVSPYLSMDVGYSFDASDDFAGLGMILNPSIGVRFMTSNYSAISVGLGYEIQKLDFYYDDEKSRAVSIHVGMLF